MTGLKRLAGLDGQVAFDRCTYDASSVEIEWGHGAIDDAAVFQRGKDIQRHAMKLAARHWCSTSPSFDAQAIGEPVASASMPALMPPLGAELGARVVIGRRWPDVRR